MTGGRGRSPPHQIMAQPANYKSTPTDLDQLKSSTQETNPVKASGRESFSSIRENDQDLAQAFTTSKVSAYAHNSEEAVDDSQVIDLGAMVSNAAFFPPATRLDSRLHGKWNVFDTSKGWKGIDVKGRLASRSFSDLAALSSVWAPNAINLQERRPSQTLCGNSALETLPLELQNLILGHLVIDIPPNSLTRRNIDLMSLLLTSKTMNAATQVTLYRQITIPHSRIYRKFLTQLVSYPALGELVRRLDFCHFNPNMMFSTASERSLAQNLTASTVLQALRLTPNLQEFLAQEHIDTDLDEQVLRKLFYGLERITALDFCGSSSAAFRAAFTAAIPSSHAWAAGDLALKRLSLHKCTTLPSYVFETLLPHLPRLTHLDVAGTRMTDAALAAIPASARITHLNLAKCTNLSADAIINFLATHPAVTGSPGVKCSSSIVWLSLSADATTHETFDEDAVTRLLPLLPRSLKSLSLKGSKMNTAHIALLLPLTKHLEELALGRGLSITDTNALIAPPPPAVSTTNEDADADAMEIDDPAAAAWEPHTLRYLDLSDLWATELPLATLYDTKQCALLSPQSAPLEVLEVHPDVGKNVGAVPLTRRGWHSSEAGRRVWIVRDGERPLRYAPAWKMGADSWGARKVAVARADVGGMYGSYMFARRL